MVIKKNNDRGQALIIVLLMATTIFIIGGAALSLGSTVRKNAVYEINQTKAYYIAEAGVEMALNEAKRSPNWVKNLSLKNNFENTEDEVFLSNLKYPEQDDERNLLESVRVIKTDEDTNNNEVTMKIKSIGRFNQSKKTLIVEVKITNPFPEYLFRGIWTSRFSNLPQGSGVAFTIDTYVSEEDLTVPSGSDVEGNIYCKGRVTLEDGNKNKYVTLNGDIYALGGVVAGDYARINGNLYVDNASKVTFGKDVTHNGQVVVLGASELASKIPPPLPDLLSADKLDWYQNNADFFQIPANMEFQSGIYYIEGDLQLSGDYSGQATLVVNGKVTIGGPHERYLRRSDNDDCLVILATDIIETHNAQVDIEAFLYSQRYLDIKNDTEIIGGLITPEIRGAQGRTITIKEDQNMLGSYEDNLTWTTAFMKILRWSY